MAKMAVPAPASIRSNRCCWDWPFSILSSWAPSGSLALHSQSVDAEHFSHRFQFQYVVIQCLWTQNHKIWFVINYNKCNISFLCNFQTKQGFIILTEDLEAPEYVDSENGKDFENLLKINFIEIWFLNMEKLLLNKLF